MLTNDFVGRIALDPLRTGIPGHNMTISIKHYNGVVGEVLDHEPERFSYIGQRRCFRARVLHSRLRWAQGVLKPL